MLIDERRIIETAASQFNEDPIIADLWFTPEDRTALMLCCIAPLLYDTLAIEILQYGLGKAEVLPLMMRVKLHDCTRSAALDGSWGVCPYTRLGAQAFIKREIELDDILHIRQMAIRHYEGMLAILPDDGFSVADIYRWQLRFMAAYQQLICPDRVEQGLQRLEEMWLEYSSNCVIRRSILRLLHESAWEVRYWGYQGILPDFANR